MCRLAAAHKTIRLMLLGLPPDMVHGVLLHRARTSIFRNLTPAPAFPEQLPQPINDRQRPIRRRRTPSTLSIHDTTYPDFCQEEIFIYEKTAEHREYPAFCGTALTLSSFLTQQMQQRHKQRQLRHISRRWSLSAYCLSALRSHWNNLRSLHPLYRSAGHSQQHR